MVVRDMSDPRSVFMQASSRHVLLAVLRIYCKKQRMLLSLAVGILGLRMLLRKQQNERRDQEQSILDQKPSETLTVNTGGLACTPKKQKAVAVDKTFVFRLARILPVLVPSWRSKEALLLVTETSILVARSLLSLHISELMGKGIQCVAMRSPEMFLVTLGDFFASGIMASVANSALKYMGNLMSTWFRENLTRHVHMKYMQKGNYYHTSVMMQANGKEEQLDNLDQRIVSDLHNFTKLLADLYSRTFKPALDVLLYTRAMAKSLGLKGPLLMYSYFVFSSTLIRKASPPLAKLTARQQAIEGDFRRCHSRLLAHAEEIAFFAGADREEMLLNDQLLRISSFSEHLHLKQFQQGVMDSFGLKYFASCVGWPVIAVPFILSGSKDDGINMLAQYRVADDLIRQSSASLGDLLMVYKKLQTLSGFTARVSELIEALECVSDRPERRLLCASSSAACVGGSKGNISVTDVRVETPDGRLLVDDLTMELQQGESLLVTGPNGAGKTSLFRVLAGLWPVRAGQVLVPDPAPCQMLYLPQTPYLVMGTVRDQVIYPDSFTEAARKHNGQKSCDLKVRHCLQTAGLERLADCSLDRLEREWDDVLSGGEKQRLGWARLYYHTPAFAALDEATSAVNVQQEGPLYQAALDRHITLLSIAHRPTVRKFHQRELNLVGDGSGACTLQRISLETNLTPSHGSESGGSAHS
mmetsp:Transcript_37550/g.74570  ORF Transcript_37550/g.74570 Transcript_37550/m.74570 type:complete len:699 (-) Transcript_37550:94-2190(-)